jgi:hypothetical protein
MVEAHSEPLIFRYPKSPRALGRPTPGRSTNCRTNKLPDEAAGPREGAGRGWISSSFSSADGQLQRTGQEPRRHCEAAAQQKCAGQQPEHEHRHHDNAPALGPGDTSGRAFRFPFLQRAALRTVPQCRFERGAAPGFYCVTAVAMRAGLPWAAPFPLLAAAEGASQHGAGARDRVPSRGAAGVLRAWQRGGPDNGGRRGLRHSIGGHRSTRSTHTVRLRKRLWLKSRARGRQDSRAFSRCGSFSATPRAGILIRGHSIRTAPGHGKNKDGVLVSRPAPLPACMIACMHDCLHAWGSQGRLAEGGNCDGRISSHSCAQDVS